MDINSTIVYLLCVTLFAAIYFILDVTARWRGNHMEMQYACQPSLPSSPLPSLPSLPRWPPPRSTQPSTPRSTQQPSPWSTQPSTPLHPCNKHSNGRPPVPAQRTHYMVLQNAVPQNAVQENAVLQFPKYEHFDERDTTSNLHRPRNCADTNDKDTRKPPPVPTAKKPVISVDNEQNDTDVSDDNNHGSNGI